MTMFITWFLSICLRKFQGSTFFWGVRIYNFLYMFHIQNAAEIMLSAAMDLFWSSARLFAHLVAL
jgi:hypothetical protein